MKDIKSKGAVAGIIAAILYGGAEMLDHEARIVALEAAAGIVAAEGEDPEAQDDPEAQEAQEPPESDEDEIEAAEAEAESQPLIEANKED